MSSFREMAKVAKQRLGTGFWDVERSDRERAVLAAREQGREKECFDFYVRSLRTQISSAPSAEEQELYAKVCAILARDSHAPVLREMIDWEHMNTLDERQRERYIFGLNSKIQNCVERYWEEVKFRLA